MKVINLAAGPGAGKSTTAAGLFNLMKRAGIQCELVTEAAKELTYERAAKLRANQLWVFAEQENRLRRLNDEGVDWAITDSPLYLALAYHDKELPYAHHFERLVGGLYGTYDNINYFLTRTKAYQRYGRGQTEAEARLLDARIYKIALKFDGEMLDLPGDGTAPLRIATNLFGTSFQQRIT